MNAELIVFVVFAIAAIAGGITMIAARNPIYSAMGLLMAMFSVAVFYVLNDAHFIAAVQVLIYAGAVMTLFLFVIMLIGVDRSEDPTEKLPLQRPFAVVLGAGLLALVLIAARNTWVSGRGVFSDGEANGTIEAVSEQLFDAWMLPFLATVLLLTIAAVGTIALAQFLQPSREPAPPLVVVDRNAELLARYELTMGTGIGAPPPDEEEEGGVETTEEAG